MIGHFCCRQTLHLSASGAPYSSPTFSQPLSPQHQESPKVLEFWGPNPPTPRPRSSMEGSAVPPSEVWSCQLQGWRIWGWLSEHLELGRGLERGKLVLHKTLTHAEKSRVFESFSWGMNKTSSCMLLTNEQELGDPGDLWKSGLGSEFFEVLSLLQGGNESHVHLPGGK